MADNESKPIPPTDNTQGNVWERNLINRLVFAGLNEQRRARRWSIFFKSLLFLYLLVLLLMYLPEDWSGPVTAGRHTALVDLQGVIADDTQASADNIITGLRAAFKDKNTAGVILRINSPGGSPVQAGYINDEIQRLRAKYPNIPLYAVITDICASGGYYVAVAADKIYVDKASLVGSIGVLMDSFGFVGTMEKLGVERRLLTAGEHKGFLDPFSPVKPSDVQHVEGLLKDIHRQFIDTVKKGRGTRLKADADLFNGLVWTGEQGINLGLADALGSSGYVAREVIHAADIVDFTPHENYLDQLTQRFGVTLANSVFSALGLQGAKLH
ncbi:MAG TPA: S49 family peptidase [Gammaproteobacteria bacterium]|nr:S49 family peptidase [Gammaproteobacteria bacterium]